MKKITLIIVLALIVIAVLKCMKGLGPKIHLVNTSSSDRSSVKVDTAVRFDTEFDLNHSEIPDTLADNEE